MELQEKSTLSKKHIIFIISTFGGYLVYAFLFNGFGTNAPVMMKFYSITSTQQGFIFTMQSIGALLMAIYLSLHGERYNKIYLSALGVLMFGAASLAVGFAPPYIALILLVMVGGAGYSILDVMLNSIIPELYPKLKNTLLPILHAFFGAGAMLIPLIVTGMVNPDIPATFTGPFLLIGGLGIGVAVLLYIAGRNIIAGTPYSDMESVKKRVAENPAEIFKTGKAWAFLMAGFLYFTFQVGIISWLPSYCEEVGMDFSTSGRMLTAFFVGSLIMRFTGPLILKKLTAQKAYIFFSFLSGLAIAAALIFVNPTLMMILLVLGGFMQGSCVAFLFLMCTEAFPHRVASASSLVSIAVNVAAMSAPLWMGGIAEITGGFLLPLLLVCASMVLSVVLVFLIGRREKNGAVAKRK